MLYREITGTNTVCGQNVQCLTVKLDCTHSTHQTSERTMHATISTGNFCRHQTSVTLSIKTYHYDPLTHITAPKGQGNHHFTE
jgi:hypothetical protein